MKMLDAMAKIARDAGYVAGRGSLRLFFETFYGLEVEGLENLEKAGDTPIFVLNHVSFLDAPIAACLTDRRPMFAVNTGIAGRWWLKPFLSMFNALPLDPTKPMATRTLINQVRDGHPLVIFPEGRITVTGSMMKVYDGAAMVADKTGAMVVPVRIEGPEKTIFSRLPKERFGKRLRAKTRVTILEPVRIEVPALLKGRKRRQAAGAELQRLMSNLVFQTSSKSGTIFDAVVRAATEFGEKRTALQDPVGGSLNYRTVLTGTRVLAKRFAAMFPKEQRLGIMLPNANGSAVTLLAVMSAGKTPAMINFSAGASNVIAACQAAELHTVLTSREFLTRAKLWPLVDAMRDHVQVVYLDDIKASVGTIEKAAALLNRHKAVTPSSSNDAAAILFTSGSEGTPKGVVLTHANILANASQAAAVVEFNPSDKVFNVLPLFHSFGLTAGLILPLTAGVPVYMFPSPLMFKAVPEAIYGSNATIIFGTDTFLTGYARTAHPYDLRSIRYCFAGAEPVKEQTRKTYMEKFGIRILEGYGVTEAAPVLALNTPMFNRSGSVGKLLPGIEARIEPMDGIDGGGRLKVRGPNVMAGYLRHENPGVLEALVDGWHDTGDIVEIDDDGFLFIKGRAKRFAKIGGEMVSLAAVESMASSLWQTALCAVAIVPDIRKGERLVLVTDHATADRKDLVQFARSEGFPELAIPSEIIISKVPLLGSGKIDFPAVTQIAGGK